MRWTRPFLGLLVCLVCCAAAVAAADDGPAQGFDELRRTLSALAADSPGGTRVGIAVVDVATGADIFSRNPDEPMNPASNTKVVTAACALKLLGPEFRFVTSLQGILEGPVIRGPIYLKGHADPLLVTADLWEMVHSLVEAGVRRVEGGIVVDNTYFDNETLPYAFDQQPDEDASFRAPIGAVSLNRNAQAIAIRPGPAVMSPARVSLDPPGYAVLENDTITVAEGASAPKISSAVFENRTRIRVWGQIALNARPVTYFRRTDNPSIFSGEGLKAVLEASGISVGGSVQLGTMPPGLALLAEHVSEPLSSVLWETGKMSDNFVTEMILKTIGAERGKGPGSAASAIAAAQEVLKGWGLEPGTYVYRNGSGLFDANRFSARQFVKLLAAVYHDAAIRPEFLSQLATGGADGTIETRYKDKAALRHVRAKTGTLADVVALTGYVFDAAGARPIAFSILVSGADGYVSSVRTYQERLVTAIAKFLNP